MSHVAVVQAEIKDLDALRAACKRLGLEWREGQRTYRWVGKWFDDYSEEDAAHRHGIDPKVYGKNAEHAIGVPNDPTGNEIGVVKNPNGNGYLLVWDFYGHTEKLMPILGGNTAPNLCKEYSTAVTRKWAKSQGYGVEEERRLDGSVKLVLRSM